MVKTLEPKENNGITFPKAQTPIKKALPTKNEEGNHLGNNRALGATDFANAVARGGKVVEFSDDQFRALLIFADLFSRIKKSKENDDVTINKIMQDDLKFFKKNSGEIVLNFEFNKDNEKRKLKERATFKKTTDRKRAKSKYANKIMGKVGSKIDVELNQQLKKVVKSKQMKMRDVMERKINEWVENPRDFLDTEYSLEVERKSNGYLVEESVRKQFVDIAYNKNLIQGHVLECLMREAIEELQ